MWVTRKANGPPVFAPNLAQIRVILNLQDKRKTKDANKLVKKIKEVIGERPELKKFTIDIVKAGPSSGSDISITVTGDTFEDIGKASEDLKELIRNVETKRGKENVKPVIDVASDLEEGKQEIRIVIDEPRAMRAGVSVAQASMVLRAAIAGLKVKSIKTGGENVDIMVRINESDLKTVDDIMALTVPNMMGQMIPLRAIAEKKEGKGFTIIRHKDGKKSVTVTGTVILSSIVCN